jgi:hypothetical protein
MKQIISSLITMGLIVVWLIGCDSGSEAAHVQVWLTDSPGDFQEVNIDLQSIEVHVGDDDSESGWRSVSAEKGIYNLLELTNGLDTLIGEVELPAGKISQVRLKLGNNNSVKVAGEVFDLKTPSAQQSGLKIQVHQTLEEDITYKILLDFDVARSIVLTGNGKYILKPVIRSITEAQDGAIKGVITPKESTPAVYAIMNADTLGTTFCDSTGHFLIRGLAPGSYLVSVDPSADFQPVIRENVVVTLGTVTDIGTVEILQ